VFAAALTVLAPLLAAALTAASAGPSHAQTPSPETPSPMRGKLLFLRCASCHDISAGASPKIGPNLLGVVGRRAGSLPGYSYSPAMKAQTFVWDDGMLDRWLTRPSDVVPGTAMAFAGEPSAANRAAIIAYLRGAGN
jgi:cytochrome c